MASLMEVEGELSLQGVVGGDVGEVNRIHEFVIVVGVGSAHAGGVDGRDVITVAIVSGDDNHRIFTIVYGEPPSPAVAVMV